MDGVAAGVSILDFSWVGVGPITTKYLADNGAEVVKVESMTQPDLLRRSPPWQGAVPGLNRSQFFGSYNSSKKSIRLNLKTARAREIVRDLVPHFDMVVDSFTPGTMAKWGLGYEDLSALHPSLIQLSTCMQGQTGPHAHFRGFGTQMASLAGFYSLSGYSDREPMPPYGAYTDFIVPRLACFALLSALEHRRLTGQGQFIDISQYEASLHFLAPAITDYVATGAVPRADGNRSSRYAPHGAYRCADEDGEERWIAVAVEDDHEWEGLLSVLGEQPGPEELATQLDRLRRFDEVDRFVVERVRDRAGPELCAALQRAGVPAYPVQSAFDLRVDDNLVEFGFWPWLEQTECGPMPYDGLAYRLCRTPGQQTAAPNLGEHTEEVLGRILGLTPADVEQLARDGVVD